jgi:uncharacterized membrane protein YagU involved in acid resistance
VPRVTVALGLPFGVAVWLGAHVIMVPSPRTRSTTDTPPPLKEAFELALHLVYGAVTELARRFIRQTL